MYPRYVEKKILEAMSDTRVVLISGPRQSGKTTLVKEIAGSKTPYFTLDDATVLAAAQSDPVGFIRGLERAVIDEIQRAPDLLLAIKAEVDRDKSPGRFLLTGSANLMTVPKVADSLAGRMEIVKLLPLSQSEITDTKSTILETAFAGTEPNLGTITTGAALIELVLAGGYPEALARKSWGRKQDWYGGYLDAIIQRDIQDIAQIEQLAAMPKLLSVLAEYSGQLVNYTGLGSAVGLNHVTTRKYLGILEAAFLVQTLPPWFTNRIKRITKSPKLHFLDSGLLAAQRGLIPKALESDKTPFGAILETFVLSELMKIANWSEDRFRFSHYRDKDGNEVDVVVETRSGDVVGFEVKASATVSGGDFSGLRKLQEATGDKFCQGVVLYDGDTVIPFGDKLIAAPISALWSG